MDQSSPSRCAECTPGVIPGPAGVVDPRPRDPQRPRQPAPAEGNVGAADSHAQAGR